MEEPARVSRGKKAEIIRQEIAGEVDRVLRVIFAGHQKTGAWDLEAMEMAMRTATHQAGAAALTELLKFPPPPSDQRRLPCACGRQARYRGQLQVVCVKFSNLPWCFDSRIAT
ncbi:MAG: hypothetical protein ACE15E_08170, partial [Acidobacteriota bacterium]